MSVEDILLDAEERMDKALNHLKTNLAGIRTGRAAPGLLDSVKVTVYGSQTPLKQLASVGAPEPQQLVIRPFDPSVIKDIEKAIVASELGLNPQNDGRIIRINIPPLSTDTRKKLVARIKELAEETRVSIRNVRRDANKAIETAEKDKVISEDDRDTAKEEVQELTKKYEESVGELAKGREADVMEQ
ncbi:MAG: ribosome recycling factor [Planctomycetes bacterium]|nr:ribosome recycling factor [Planctomycetota bacterium]